MCRCHRCRRGQEWGERLGGVWSVYRVCHSGNISESFVVCRWAVKCAFQVLEELIEVRFREFFNVDHRNRWEVFSSVNQVKRGCGGDRGRLCPLLGVRSLSAD